MKDLGRSYVFKYFARPETPLEKLNKEVIKIRAENARLRAELSALGPVEWEIPYHGMAWQPCSELNMDCKTKRAIRRVVEPAANA